MSVTHGTRSVQNSALWAAYGDALGFVTELAEDRAQVEWRTGSVQVSATIPWRRRIGGRFGVVVPLPAGMYSDDTQLRLAACRSIRSDGTFDVEAFSKVELPVWLSYALGGGISTKVAATNLVRREISWNRNFYSEEKSTYVDSGGNGAAMRIQPHVWAAPSGDLGTPAILDVVRNSIATHGHPRAIAAAVLHAFLLQSSLNNGRAPDPDDWRHASERCRTVPSLMASDRILATWMAEWGQVSKRDFAREWAETCGEISTHVADAAESLGSTTYGDLLQRLGGLTREYRGTGTRTVISAAWLAWKYRNSPAEGLAVAANAIGSDTDTIATMAGALLGPGATTEPPGPVVDAEYIRLQATRLARIAAKEPVESFRYPDLLYWEAPRTQLDAIGSVNGNLALSGLGVFQPSGDVYEKGTGKSGGVWGWGRLTFGQTVLVKRRPSTPHLPDSAHPRPPNAPQAGQTALFDVSDRRNHSRADSSERRMAARPKPLDLDACTTRVIQGGFDSAAVGRLLIQLAEEENGIDRAIAYAAIIAKAWRARNRR